MIGQQRCLRFRYRSRQEQERISCKLGRKVSCSTLSLWQLDLCLIVFSNIWQKEVRFLLIMPCLCFCCGKSFRNLRCCLLITCPWPHWADMDISRSWQCASNIFASLCNYLWLYISGCIIIKSSLWINIPTVKIMWCHVIIHLLRIWWMQCPPFRLSYQGLGEPLCFSAFGPFATTAFYLLLGSSRFPTIYLVKFSPLIEAFALC